MMNPALSKLPHAVGHTILQTSAKTTGWAFSQFMTAPLQNLGLGALGLAMVFSASNALYWQTSAHPSPLFSTQTTTAMNVQNTAEIVPAIQAPHPLELAVSRASDFSNSLVVKPQAAPAPVTRTAAPETGEVTNQMLADAQTMLQSMGLFSGKIDGFYGPQTAHAIRQYESFMGLTPKGALVPSIINRINSGAATSAPQAQVISAPKPPAQEPAPVSLEPAVQPVEDVLAQLTNAAAQASATQVPIVSSPVAPVTNPLLDKALIENIQRGLATLAFYNVPVDGIAGETTARAIREFENFLSFEMTGRVSTDVQQWLVDAGAYN